MWIAATGTNCAYEASYGGLKLDSIYTGLRLPCPRINSARWQTGVGRHRQVGNRWQDKAGLFHRDLGDGNAEVTIANRAYRVRIGDLRPG